MDNNMKAILLEIFLISLTVLVSLGENNVLSQLQDHEDDLSEMFTNTKDIFNLKIKETSLNSAKICTAIPQCSCARQDKELQVNCCGRNLTYIPAGFPQNVTQLLLAKNSISFIPEYIFMNYTALTHLDLGFNKITELGPNVFKGLANLQLLNLEMNQIRYINASIHPEAFRALTKLTTINIQQDLTSISEDESYPITALEHLPVLQHLAMDGLSNQSFNNPFHKLKSLEVLQLGGNSRRCNISRVSKNMFNNLPNLIDLDIQRCNLKSVQNESFMEIPGLETLDLSYNEELEFKSLTDITYGLQFTMIKKLSLTKIHTTFGDCTELTAENLQYLYNTSLKYIILDSNRLSLLTNTAIHLIPHSLVGLSLNDNKLMMGKYVIQLAIDIALQRVFANLKICLIAKQRETHSFRELLKQMTLKDILAMLADHNRYKRYLQYHTQTLSNTDVKHQNYSSDSNYATELRKEMPKFNIQNLGRNLLPLFLRECSNCQNISTKIMRAPLPPNLTVVDLSDLKIRAEIQPLCFCDNKLQNLSLDRNTYLYWKGPLIGLNELTHLYLSWNYCEKISPDFFHNFPKLNLLNISGNFLGSALEADNDGIIFSKLDKLKALHMTDNKIKFLPQNIFKGLKVLEHLSLKSNQLNNVSWNMDHMLELRTIDLSDNDIVTIDENVRKFWNRLSATGSFSVNLANNSFKCNCKNLDILKWFSETTVNLTDFHEYKCKFDNGTLGNLVHADDIRRVLTKQCATYFTLVLATSLAVLSALIIVAAGIAYRYRWNLRYMYYSAKFKLRGYRPVNIIEGDFENDVFVSYANCDDTFVARELLRELQDSRGFKLLVHGRDFLAGNYVTDNIMHAITTSRKTLIIMSEQYLHSKWCCYEMNMARMEGINTGRDVICMVMKEQVPTASLPLEIMDIIRQQTYLEYPNDDQNHLQQFWDRLADALKQ